MPLLLFLLLFVVIDSYTYLHFFMYFDSFASLFFHCASFDSFMKLFSFSII